MRPARWVLFAYALVIATGLFLALPNLFSATQLARLPAWIPAGQVTLGLDLRGGSHLVLAVDAAALERDHLERLLGEARDTLADARLPAATARIEAATVRLAFASAREAEQAAALLATPEPGPAASPAATTLVRDGAELTLRPTEAAMADRLARALEQSQEIVRTRIDRAGVSEPTIQKVGADRILVQLPGVQDPAQLRTLLGSTAQMSFHMVAAAVGTSLPAGASWLASSDAGAPLAVIDEAAIGGDRLIDSRAAFDPQTGQPIVTFTFDRAGAEAFGEITRENVGRPFAIVLDGKVLSAPVIQEPILGGQGQITGQFTVDETVVLSALLRAGALPAPLDVIEERTVGPDLGADVIETGLLTGLLGFALVCGLMIGLYRGWGLIANAALLLNVVLTLALLTLFGAALTLPGIAGMILGLGLAVDANILINERIREELRAGAKPMTAIDRGFRRAYATILDANVTALIATSLLFLVGSGPVRGFAVTMTIGILVSMFTAVSVTRLVMMEWTHRNRLKTICLDPLIRLGPGRTAISFTKARWLGVGLSLALSLASVGLFVAPGLNYGIDFEGGIQVEIANPAPVELDRLRDGLAAAGLGEVVLQNVGGAENVLIRVQQQPGGEAAQSAAVDAVRAAVQQAHPEAQVAKAEVVGPKVSGELARDGIVAVALACVAMLAYVWVRFEWHFAVGAVVTLVLDTTKAVGFFALTGLDFNLTAIAALLTIIGYSLNDKVVVYDRMRENLRLRPELPLRALIDLSLNQVAARCVYTSLATLAAMLPMAVWGGHAVENFALPLVFGVIVATTSSIYVAAPVLLWLDRWRRPAPAPAGARPRPVAA